jgi:hypothetical protein
MGRGLRKKVLHGHTLFSPSVEDREVPDGGSQAHTQSTVMQGGRKLGCLSLFPPSRLLSLMEQGEAARFAFLLRW